MEEVAELPELLFVGAEEDNIVAIAVVVGHSQLVLEVVVEDDGEQKVGNALGAAQADGESLRGEVDEVGEEREEGGVFEDVSDGLHGGVLVDGLVELGDVEFEAETSGNGVATDVVADVSHEVVHASSLDGGAGGADETGSDVLVDDAHDGVDGDALADG